MADQSVIDNKPSYPFRSVTDSLIDWNFTYYDIAYQQR